MIKYVATRTKERLKFDTEGEIRGSGNAEGTTPAKRIRVLERGNRYETQETAVTSIEQVKKPDAH